MRFAIFLFKKSLLCSCVLLLSVTHQLCAGIALYSAETELPAVLDKKLAGAGEMLSVQLYAGCRIAFILQVTPPTNLLALESSSEISISLYEIKESHVESFPFTPFYDILVPIELPAFKGDVFLQWKPEEKTRYYWVDIMADQKCNKKRLSLLFTDKLSSQEKISSISVQINCLPSKPISLPLKIIYNEYGPDYLEGVTENYEEQLRFEVDIFRQVRRLNGVLMPLPYKSQRGTPRKNMVPVLKTDQLGQIKLDWREFDRRFGPLLSGKAFPDGVPLEEFYLPFNPEWPAPFRLYKEKRQEYEWIWEEVAAQFIQHFRSMGWTRTRYQIYLNQKPGKNNQIPWNLDEPRGRKDFNALHYYAELTRQAFAAADSLIFDFRIDISHWFCEKHRGSQLKDFALNGGPQLLSEVDLWCIAWHSLSGVEARKQARKMIEKGKRVWLYGKTPRLTDSAQTIFRNIYYAYLNNWDGFLIWKSFSRKVSKNLGADFVMYQKEIGKNVCIHPSLRAKRMACAIDDLIIFSQYKNKNSNFNNTELMKDILIEIPKFRKKLYQIEVSKEIRNNDAQ